MTTAPGNRPPAQAEPSARPPISRQSIIVWTTAGLLVLSLLLFVLLLVIPLLQTQRELERFAAGPNQFAEIPNVVIRLGGPEPSARKLRVYLSMPMIFRAHRSEAINILGHCGSYGAPGLTAALKDRDSRIRPQAARLLGFCGKGFPDAVPALIECLGDSDPNVRMYAAGSLGHLMPASAVSIPNLITALNDVDPRVMRYAAWALSQMGPTAASAIPPLRTFLAAPDPQVRVSAASAIHRIMPGDASVIPVLMEVLSKGPIEARANAAEGLADIKPPVKQAVPVLQEILAYCGDSDFYSAKFAGALARIDPTANNGLDMLIRMLERDGTYSSSAARALGEVGPPAKAAIPALKRALGSENPWLRKNAAKALQNIGDEEAPK